MTAETTKRYALRLRARFVDYAPDNGRILWREFPKDKIVTNQADIEFLESHNAPVEKIEI
jgi:hypothetical protein